MSKYTKEQLVAFETYVSNLFELGLVSCPVHLSGGNEDQLITIFNSINPKDYIFTGHRNHYHYLLKGGDPWMLVEELRGTTQGVCHGKGRSMHLYDPSINFFSSGIVAGTCAIAVGVAIGLKKKYRTRRSKCPHVWCFVGDGAEDSGHYMESVRFGISRDLPLTFVVEDNDLAVESTKRDRWHRYVPFNAPNIIRYNYERTWPHVGVGKHVSF